MPWLWLFTAVLVLILGPSWGRPAHATECRVLNTCEMSPPERVQACLAAGADPTATTKAGQLPWDVAQDNAALKATDAWEQPVLYPHGGVARPVLAESGRNSRVSTKEGDMNWQMVGAVAQIGQCLILAVAGVFAWVQLRKMSEQQEKMRAQHELDRLIAWKTSVQEVNHLIFGDPETFRKVLYPKAETDEEVRMLTAAYSSLHALEVIYYMRKDDEGDTGRLQDFLKEYVSSGAFKNMWANDAFRAAFSEDFRKAIGKHIAPSN